MKRLMGAVTGLLISGVLVASGMGAEPSKAPRQKRQKAVPAARYDVNAADSKVPQAQRNVVKKREDAKKRRDELRKMRDANVRAAD